MVQQSTGEQRVEVLLQLSDQQCYLNIDSAITYARQALVLSSNAGNEDLETNARRMLGSLLIS